MLNQTSRRKATISFLWISFFLTASIISEACNPCKCAKTERLFRTEKADLGIYREYAKPDVVIQEVSDSGKVSVAEFLLKLNFNYSYHSSNDRPFQFSVFNHAMACDCRMNGDEGSDEKLVSVQFVTVNAYSSTFSASDTINSLVRFNGSTIPDFIVDWNKENDQFYMMKQKITLTQMPDMETWQRLRVEIKFEKHSLIAESGVFWLIP
ncbi:MAG: hypothetical protein KG003_14645 [Bacteroidetes bacterium]|nr:hypothetical protein [Bacteroidota bacterium]